MGHAKIAAVAILASLMLAAAPASQPTEPRLKAAAPDYARQAFAELLRVRSIERLQVADALEAAKQALKDAPNREKHPTFAERRKAGETAAADIKRLTAKLAEVSRPDYLPREAVELHEYPPKPDTIYAAPIVRVVQADNGKGMAIVELSDMVPWWVANPPQPGDFVGVQVDPNNMASFTRPEPPVERKLGVVALAGLDAGTADGQQVKGDRFLIRIGSHQYGAVSGANRTLPMVAIVDLQEWLEDGRPYSVVVKGREADGRKKGN